ncbi:hypothetical protein OHA72_46205 [Dactylosporangium sp. NBC_01737]|uniref:hypothetical protein n=1 Tax=Dactylosporangium sp. NBC_01737 TaxID=2975959 RepID=UPI002E12FF6C|nr:hypothetical protein OHA72_46205 [Dactylosporangium sp. NBC_01737]
MILRSHSDVPIGAAVRALARDFARDHRNPLGLAYMVYHGIDTTSSAVIGRAMRNQLPAADEFDAFDVIRLDEDGGLLDGAERVPPGRVAAHLRDLVAVPRGVTDVFVFAHGWQNTGPRADAASRRLFAGIRDVYREDPGRYPALDGFRPAFFSVQWPSQSLPTAGGYRKIRDRAHEMTTTGHAAHVVAALLGLLDAERVSPYGPDTLRTAGGQYLHCVGHSFGCRLLGEAIREAAAPPEHRVLAWPWASRHEFAVDSFTGLQMAARTDVFRHRFRSLVDGGAPIVGPVALTVSPHDRALSLWHQVPEGEPGLGARGALDAPTIPLHRVDEAYTTAEFGKVTNVDAGWRYTGGSMVQGAHSDIWYPETIHLLLSLAALSR